MSKVFCFIISPLPLLLLSSLLLRVAAVWHFRADLTTDPDAYVALAEHLAAGDGFINSDTKHPTAYRPPLYPLLLSLLHLAGWEIVGLAVLQIVLGVLTVWLTVKLGTLLYNQQAGLLAGFIVAIDPLLLRYTAQPMTETLFTFLVTALLLWLLPVFQRDQPTALSHRWIAGVLFGLCALCRPTIWMFAVFCVLWQTLDFLQHRKQRSFQQELRRVLPVILGGLLVVSPWIVRNVVQLGKPIVTTTHGGYTLLLGNNPVFYREVVAKPWGTVWTSESLHSWQASLEADFGTAGIARTDETARDAWMYARARTEIANQPVTFFRACWLRILRFWNVVPLGEQASSLPVIVKWGIGGWYLLLLCGLAFSGWRIKQAVSEFAIPLWLLLGSFTLVHTVYWSNMRMRSPLIPAIAVLIAMGVATLKTKPASDSPQLQTPQE